MANRWWIYQRERFPIYAHSPLIATFSISAMSYSALLRGEPRLRPASVLVAFGIAWLFFLQLRIADEFKDCADDALYRPYRPVPRGLVTLRELGVLGVLAALLQTALAVWLKPALLLLVGLTWAYFALMSVEFFVPTWLKARPVTYMWTHMLILPLIDLDVTACDWLVQGARLPQGLVWFLLLSFFNGMVVEIGRKIRAPGDEEHGVDTYSKLWGRRRAAVAWLGVMLACVVAAGVAAAVIRFLALVAVVLLTLLAMAVWQVRHYLAQPTSRVAKRFELLSGMWTLAVYLSTGLVPLLLANR